MAGADDRLKEAIADAERRGAFMAGYVSGNDPLDEISMHSDVKKILAENDRLKAAQSPKIMVNDIGAGRYITTGTLIGLLLQLDDDEKWVRMDVLLDVMKTLGITPDDLVARSQDVQEAYRRDFGTDMPESSAQG